MARSFLTLLLLGLSTCVSTAPTAAPPPPQISTQLSGNWTNQLHSFMTLTAHQNGSITGQYDSGVGNANGPYELTGRFDTLAKPAGIGISVGWVVTYNNERVKANSTATWSGQYFNHGGIETILTQWLLTGSTDGNNVWQSTRLGHDEFVRVRPQVAEAH